MPPGVLDDSTVLDTEPVVLGSYDAEPMGGVGLGRLWDTHPKVAFVLHLLVTVYLGALAVCLLVTGATGGWRCPDDWVCCDGREPVPVYLASRSEQLAIG